MLKFKVQIKLSLYEFEIAKIATISELKALIVAQQNIEEEFDLYIFDQILKDQVSVSKIIYNCKTDHLVLRLRQRPNISKLKSFFMEAVPLLKQKTLKSTAKLKENLEQQQIISQPKQIDNAAQIISFFTKAPNLMKQKTTHQLSTFFDKLRGQTTMSQIKQMDEEVPRNLNNDTVFNILDDMKQEEEKDRKQARNSKKQKKSKKNSLSPKQELYLIRKQKALQLLEDPKQKEKAKLLIQEMKKQKMLLLQKKQEQYEQSSEFRERSLIYYQKEREELVQQIVAEKRNRIMERLSENQQHHKVQMQFNKQSQLLINDLNKRMKKQQETMKSKEAQLEQMYFEEAKLKLQEKKKQATPIRLSELNAHEEHYLENKEMLKLQRDQKKLEEEIKIRSETKHLYRDQKVLQEVIKIDRKLKMKDLESQKKKQEQQKRKQKYSEIISEFHRPNNISKIEEAKASIDEESSMRYSMHNQQHKSSFVELLANQGLQRKNIKKIQSALSQQHITPKTQITKSLQEGKVPDASTYFHLRVHTPQKLIILQDSSSKKKDYLREFEQERRSLHQSALPQLQSINRYIGFIKYHQKPARKLEQQAKKKEQLAQVCGNEDLQNEATDLYLQSVKAKLQFLDKKLSNF